MHKDFQDRTVKIWEQLASVRRHSRLATRRHTNRRHSQHYKDNTWVAGYNPINEPTDEEQTRLIDFYNRIEKVIRAIDPNHILFLE